MRRKQIRAFISYSSKDKDFAGKIKDKLSEFDIKCFLAHEDMNTSAAWEQQIINELKKCDIFIPILSYNFRKSDWTQMELGSIILRKILIIPLSLDETVPFGFIRQLNGKSIGSDIPISYLITPILERRQLTRHMTYLLIKKLRAAGSFMDAECLMGLLEPYFKTLSPRDRDRLVEYSIENNQIWSADNCRELLKSFLRIHRKNSRKKKFIELSKKIIGKRFYES